MEKCVMRIATRPGNCAGFFVLDTIIYMTTETKAGSDSVRQADAHPAGRVLQFPAITRCGIRDVQRINPFSFYELSKALKQLAVHREITDPQHVMWELVTARSALVRLKGGDPIQLEVSRAPMEEVEKFVAQIQNEHLFEPDQKGGHRFRENPVPIPEWKWNWYRDLLQKFETVLTEEMREASTYYVPRRGIFSTAALVDRADDTFPEAVRGAIPEKTKTDWRAAGRCLAFNLLSASGFHVARAVEGTIEAYYQFFASKPGVTQHGWYDYAKELQAIRDSGTTPAPSEKTLAEILQMKDDYRNPLMHPRVVLTESDSRMLFANGESLIIAMAQEITDAKQAGQPTLNLLAAIGGVGA